MAVSLDGAWPLSWAVAAVTAGKGRGKQWPITGLYLVLLLVNLESDRLLAPASPEGSALDPCTTYICAKRSYRRLREEQLVCISPLFSGALPGLALAARSTEFLASEAISALWC